MITLFVIALIIIIACNDLHVVSFYPKKFNRISPNVQLIKLSALPEGENEVFKTSNPESSQGYQNNFYDCSNYYIRFTHLY